MHIFISNTSIYLFSPKGETEGDCTHYYTTPNEESNKKKIPFPLLLISAIIVLSIAGLASGIYIYGGVDEFTAELFPPSDPTEPIQKPYTGDPIIMGDFKLTPVAAYEITGVVVSTRTYDDDFIPPIDVCMIWGDLAKPENRNNARFTQGDRFCNYDRELQFKEFYFRSHYSNNHLIPASDSIALAFNDIKVNEKITLKGYLVNVESSSKQWKTSLSRFDTGWGACENIYVTELTK